jgi:hypothetical protein
MDRFSCEPLSIKAMAIRPNDGCRRTALVDRLPRYGTKEINAAATSKMSCYSAVLVHSTLGVPKPPK